MAKETMGVYTSPVRDSKADLETMQNNADEWIARAKEVTLSISNEWLLLDRQLWKRVGYWMSRNTSHWNKLTVTTETYSRPSNDKNEAFCIFLEYFLHLVAEKNRIFEPLSTLCDGILLSDVLGGMYGKVWYHKNVSFTHWQLFTSHVFLRNKKIVCLLLAIKQLTLIDIFSKHSRGDYYSI